MNDVNYLVGSEDISAAPMNVYSDEATAFLSELSTEIMKDKRCRAYPDVMSVAFWCRKANIVRLRESYHGAEHRLGKGLAFHIAPSNIPVNFAFTYFFSLLSGNASIVRVPSKPFVQVEIICNAVNAILDRHPEVKSRTAFVTYPRDDKITAHFCAMADIRVIWGGDETIADIRLHPVKPRCIDLVFADRYSISILDGDAVLDADDKVMTRLAEGFYNDTYLMDQNACSSPQMIFWQNGSKDAVERFWDAVINEANKRYLLQGMTAVDKYTHLCEDSIEHDEISHISRQCGNLLYRAEILSLPKSSVTELRGKGGYFYEYSLKSLDELIPLITQKYQTITYFGPDPEKLRDFVIKNRLSGIDRIVPVGAAMDIGVIWDGYDIVTMLSRVVHAV